MNGGKDFCEWSKRDKELANSIGKIIEFTLGKYGKGLVNLALAESFLEKGEDSYEIANLTNKGMMQAQAGGEKNNVSDLAQTSSSPLGTSARRASSACFQSPGIEAAPFIPR